MTAPKRNHGRLSLGPTTGIIGTMENGEQGVVAVVTGANCSHEFKRETARRLVACWNRSDGWSTDLMASPDAPRFIDQFIQLGSIHNRLMQKVVDVSRERDAAFALLREVLDEDGPADVEFHPSAYELAQRIRALLDGAAPESGVERRRELVSAPLPLDAECALERAALELSQAGKAEAHAQVVGVLAQHLPKDPA